MINTGLHKHRFKNNPREKIFAGLWEEINSISPGKDILDYLLSENTNEPNGEVTDRDRIVAATIIQWLGSPIGQAFLSQANVIIATQEIEND